MTYRKANAMPTKRFFIEMLTKDIDLEKAISELVDNCMDGAANLRNELDYNGIVVELECFSKKFSIKDNCGGIPIEIAENEAFRFGKPEEVDPGKFTVGRFGVGMKRALFKLGKKISIISKTKNCTYSVDIDVDEWVQDTNSWNFPITLINEGVDLNHEEQIGTTIEVTQLYNDISELFLDDNFNITLLREIRSRQKYNLTRGADVKLNGKSLKPELISYDLNFSDEFKPAYKRLEINGVMIDIFAGIGAPSPSTAGWYIFCNERLIVEADKTPNTGWVRGNGGKKFHNDFARFRGFCFFKSENSRLLPWNTTKTGMDLTSDIYRQVKIEMLHMMIPLLSYLKKANDERRKDNTTAVEKLIESAKIDILEIRANKDQLIDEIVAPIIIEKPKTTQSISYRKSYDLVEEVKKKLGVSTYEEVGERTFDYYVKREMKK